MWVIQIYLSSLQTKTRANHVQVKPDQIYVRARVLVNFGRELSWINKPKGMLIPSSFPIMIKDNSLIFLH